MYNGVRLEAKLNINIGEVTKNKPPSVLENAGGEGLLCAIQLLAGAIDKGEGQAAMVARTWCETKDLVENKRRAQVAEGSCISNQLQPARGRATYAV